MIPFLSLIATLTTASFLLDFIHEGEQIITSVHVIFYDREVLK